ncbi:hypothetical protein AGABI1DRAFT_99944 [Agaricus bisporus var. burnettii JB137-S8]|uniref:DEAD-domain-containing protein n=1 Tax=Agaricus bisporus var. burnettii (strain JB137-S8 / ATCC MYA-4627 / FGSC 10392) TaxID=597362 RepID=K5WXU6_AGABU|nr:uncharacterized protein AGABI1DRAFT_99944 [Agaricus bisporus var. burnettii JB137-S8]EKM80336.1 hypothetical protein AGABI1DRAFT_99944 [Agaricus bisporus var. burnettii JB137-S8]
MSIRIPTEVQTACIPPLLSGRDCIGNAKTGSGKTIAFALPILQKLSADPYGIYALVLTPTRELAFQIAEQFAVLGAALNVQTAVVVGGMDMMAQALELENRPHVVIATPGRIVDHLRSSSGQWNLSRVTFLVLDEADRLLTPTFAPELSYLFDVLPKDRQTCLFTATWTSSIDAVADAPPKPGKQKPFIHRMKEMVETVSTLKQHYILVPSHVREAYLFHILCNPPESTLHLRRAPPEPMKNNKKTQHNSRTKKQRKTDDEIEQPPPTIIFCAKPRTAAYLTSLLKTLSIRSTALHSRLTQRERLSSLSLFKASVIPVLISTDVGARGLDIEDVAMVINWDLPQEPEEYTHRVGRTARAGKGGLAVSFVTERDEEKILEIENRINMKLDEMELSEEKVLEKLNTVSTAKRLANMELHDAMFGKRERIHQIKKANLTLSGFAEGSEI